MKKKLIFAFQFDDDSGADIVYITPKDEFIATGYLSGDSAVDTEVGGINLDDHGFFELMENIFEFEWTTDVARDKLISLGLEESKALENFLSGSEE
jgi:hypothetical protein